jgi:hypothetical protein
MSYQISTIAGWTSMKGNLLMRNSSRRVSPLLLKPAFVALQLAACGELIDPQVAPEASVPAQNQASNAQPLTIVQGAIPVGSNPHGISGEGFVLHSPLGTEIELDVRNGALCATGSVSRIVDVAQWQEYWGAWLGLNLTPNPIGWDRDGVIGLRFRLDGDVPPSMSLSALPIDWDGSGASYCKRFEPQAGETVEVYFDELEWACWSPGGEGLGETRLKALTWGVNTDTESAHPFSFCVSELTPLLQ